MNTKMEYRYLGNSGLKVSVIGLGNWLNEKDDQAKNTEIVKKAYELGINFFDTAEIYGFGKGEAQLGKALQDLKIPRESIIVTTKVWRGTPSSHPNAVGTSRKRVFECVHLALKRMNLEYLDIVYAHRHDEDTPIEEICKAYNDVIQQGLAFYWGTSEWSAAQVVDALKTCERYNYVKPIVEQVQYNMLTNRERFEEEYAIIFDTYGYGTTIWSPLAGGILTGKYNQGCPEGARFQWVEMPIVKKRYTEMFEEKKEQTLKMLNDLETIAKELGGTMAQLAMAWCLNNKNVSCALTGATKPEQLEDSVKAIELYKKFTPKLEQKLEEILGTQPNPAMQWKTFTQHQPRRQKVTLF